jgi:hypothetical protein
MAERPGRDRSGEPFEDNFTENRGVRRPLIEDAQHHFSLDGEQVENVERREETDGTKEEQHSPKEQP